MAPKQTEKPVRVPKAVTERERWLAERKGYLGATEVAAILGLHPYMSAHSVWLSKMGLSEDESNIAMRAGIHMEPFIAKEFATGMYQGGELFRALPLRVIKSKTYRHHEFPFLACNPDREIQGFRVEGKRLRVGLECKRVGHWASRNFGQDGSDQVPEHYLIQILWQMLIGRFDMIVLAALIDDREVRPYSYTFDPELSAFAHVFPKQEATDAFRFAIKWWNRHIEQRIEPQLSGNDCDTSWSQKERASYGNGQLCCPDEDTAAVCLELREALAEKDRTEKRATELKNQIRQFMIREGASEMETTAGHFTYRTNAKGTPVLNTPFRGQKA